MLHHNLSKNACFWTDFLYIIAGITSKKRKKRGIYPLFFRFLSLKNATRAPTPNRKAMYTTNAIERLKTASSG